jgi:hypothetical protein
VKFSPRYCKGCGWASPIFFGPGTLWRTWGTRPVPNGVLLGHRLRRAGLACGSSRQGFFLGFLLASVVALSLSSAAAVLLLEQEGSIALTASFIVV